MLLASNSINAFDIGIGLLGGLGLFLYGMHKMSDGLKAAAGDGMKVLLSRLTSNRVMAATTGAAVTTVVQSSSVTTVLVVGFVSAGLMTLSQAVGVIMGSNVGTTVTAQIVAFQVTKYSWLMVAVGFMSWSFSRSDTLRHYGAMVLGLGMLFLGMEQMSNATHPLRSYDPFIELMGRMDNPLLAIVLGASFTALVQSSSATTGIVIMLGSQGILSLEGGIALAIGSNIGTCFTAVLSAVGKPTEAKRAAVVHVVFNVLGALLWVFLIHQLADFTRAISPTYGQLHGPERLAAETPRQIANANTLFNIANTIVLIWFTGPIGSLATWLVPDKPEPEKRRVELKYLDSVYLETPSLALDRVRLEIEHMGEVVLEMLQLAPQAGLYGDEEQLRTIAELDDDVDRLHEGILQYLSGVGREELPTEESKRLERLAQVANYLENTGDLIETNLVAQGRKRFEQQIEFAPREEHSFEKVVIDAMRDAVQAFVNNDRELANHVIQQRTSVQTLADQAMTQLGYQLLQGGEQCLQAVRIHLDLVGIVKRVYHNSRRIAEFVSD